jgi:hypothetical protein
MTDAAPVHRAVRALFDPRGCADPSCANTGRSGGCPTALCC